MKKVQVLLSSFNGKRYIRQQLDSIFNQQGVEVYCLVRDDGSVDGTLDILSEYQQKYNNLEVIKGKNVGYKKSFMELVYLSGQYDYYAFADQDDVWEHEKLLKAIEQISQVENNSAVMYCSNCKLVDNNLNDLGMLHYSDNIIPSNKVKVLIQGFAHGCTMVFNGKSMDLILKYRPKQEYAHDFWIPIILMFLGKVIYDKDSYILYRQHTGNIFGSKSPIKKIIKIKQKRFNEKNFYSDMISEILNGYGKFLEREDYITLKEICEYRNSFYKKLKLIFNKQFKKNNFKGTLFIKFLVLCSKF
jgi:glycosyltransferase involved in cell wall biosynthesis